MTDVASPADIARLRGLMRAAHWAAFAKAGAEEYRGFAGHHGLTNKVEALWLLDNPQLEVFFTMERARPGLDFDAPLLLPSAVAFGDVFFHAGLLENPVDGAWRVAGENAPIAYVNPAFGLRSFPDGTVSPEVVSFDKRLHTVIALNKDVEAHVRAALRFQDGFFTLDDHADGQLLVAKSADGQISVNVAFFTGDETLLDLFSTSDFACLADFNAAETEATAGLEHVDGDRWRFKNGVAPGRSRGVGA